MSCAWRSLSAADPAPLSADSPTLGAYLRAVREHKGLSLIQVAEATRVRRLYLEALERDDITPLPSRPFAVGYVRAYGRALGLDGDAAVARFKAENPEATQALRAPLGVHLDGNPRRRVIYAGAAVLVVAVALWNIAQHTLISNTRSDAILPPMAQSWPEAQRPGPVVISAPTPPPADQTTPRPYVTPGLGVPGIDKNAPTDPAAVAAAATTAAAPAGAHTARHLHHPRRYLWRVGQGGWGDDPGQVSRLPDRARARRPDLLRPGA